MSRPQKPPVSWGKVLAVKPLADLTVEDLTATRVWRYEGGGGAEALVVPAQRDSLSRMDDDVFLAATEFELPDSSRHLGFCFPADDSGIEYLQPVIVARGGQVGFWFDRPVTQEMLSAQWRVLGKGAEEIFPVRFHCLVPVDGQTVSGVISHVEFSSDISHGCPNISEAPGSVARELQRVDESIFRARPSKARPLSGRRIEAVEKRTAPRHEVEMMVEFGQDAFRGTGMVGNVSRNGMFVHTTRIPSTGPQVRLTVHLQEGRTLLLTGRVVRSAPAPEFTRPVPTSGFGLRLAHDSPDYEKFLLQLLEKSK